MITGLTISTSRYFSSGIPPTEPALLPRPPPKRESVSKISDFNPLNGPTVLSPPRKSRRVMPNREGFDGNAHLADRMDDHEYETRQSADERNEQAMSLDFSVFGTRPPSRPTINR